MVIQKLTIKDKINLFKYCVAEYNLCNVDYYQGINEAPLCKIRPSDYFLSDVLGIDFRELYFNEEIDRLNKLPSIKTWCLANDTNFFPDLLDQMFAEYCLMARDYNIDINDNLIKDIEFTIKRKYELFKKFCSKNVMTETNIFYNLESDFKNKYITEQKERY